MVEDVDTHFDHNTLCMHSNIGEISTVLRFENKQTHMQ